MHGRRAFPIGRALFAVAVILPVTLATVFYGVIASDRFLTESRFLVRSAGTTQVGGLASFLHTFGISRTNDDAFAVHSYIESRDALRDLMAVLPMRDILDPRGVDPISTCIKPWSTASFEALFECYQARVRIIREDQTGISRLRVDLFTPEDSYAVSEELLRLSEELANRMNRRAEEDALANATRLMAAAEERVRTAQANLVSFRNRQLLLDIDSSSSQANRVIANLALQLAETRTAMEQQAASSPSSPVIASLAVKAGVLEEQILQERLKLTGSDGALSNQIADYESLVLQRDLSDEALALASQAIDQARQEARRQSIYVETVVRPNLADESTRPRRLRMIVTVAVTSLMVFAMVWLIFIGGREHLNRE